MSQKPPPRPIDEERRQQVLNGLSLLDTEQTPEFDRVVWLAKRFFRTKIALISLIDNDRQWFLAADGLSQRQTPRDHAFCAHAIMSEEALVVLDAAQDARFAGNPLVVGPPHIRFYAGVPIKIDGATLGTLCVIDDQPRQDPSAEDLAILVELAHVLEDEINLWRHGRRTVVALERELREARKRA